MTDNHMHRFEEIEMIPVIADPPGARRKQYDFAGYGIDLPTLGPPKPMGILVRRCNHHFKDGHQCEAQKAFEYGNRKAMQAKLVELSQ